MKTAALVVAMSLAVGDPAFAAERAPSDSCQPLDKFKAAFDAKTKFSTATIGEYHVLKGIYLGARNTPEGNPPGDGALIINHAPEHGQQPMVLVTWTREDGKEVCGAANQVLVIPSAVMALVGQTETGAGETKDPDDSKDGLKL